MSGDTQERVQLLAALEAAREALRRASVKPNRAQRRAAARDTNGRRHENHHRHR